MFNPRPCFAWACVSRGAAASPGRVFPPPCWSWRRAGRGGSVLGVEGKEGEKEGGKTGGERERGMKDRGEGRESNVWDEEVYLEWATRKRIWREAQEQEEMDRNKVND